MSEQSQTEDAINLAPVLETFSTEDIGMQALISAGSDLAEQMLEGIPNLRDHLETIDPGRYTVGEVRNGDSSFSVKIAALSDGLPTTFRGMRVTQASSKALLSFALFADQDGGTLLPIDFDVIG